MTNSMTKSESAMGAVRKASAAKAEVLREYGPFGEGGIHGVTFDGALVWFARTGELVAFDPTTEKVVRRLAVPADAGTAFDGERLYQLAGGEILVIQPSDGKIVRKMPAPAKGAESGMAWADGYLWVGEYRAAKIHQVDPKNGEVVKTLASDRFVTGVSCADGMLWHGTTADDDRPGELRRLGTDGAVEESLELPADVFVSGVESDGKGAFWCGGGASGKLRLLKKRS